MVWSWSLVASWQQEQSCRQVCGRCQSNHNAFVDSNGRSAACGLFPVPVPVCTHALGFVCCCAQQEAPCHTGVLCCAVRCLQARLSRRERSGLVCRPSCCGTCQQTRRALCRLQQRTMHASQPSTGAAPLAACLLFCWLAQGCCVLGEQEDLVSRRSSPRRVDGVLCCVLLLLQDREWQDV